MFQVSREASQSCMDPSFLAVKLLTISLNYTRLQKGFSHDPFEFLTAGILEKEEEEQQQKKGPSRWIAAQFGDTRRNDTRPSDAPQRKNPSPSSCPPHRRQSSRIPADFSAAGRPSE